MDISLKLAGRLPGSTLVEVLVALVVYTLLIAIVASLFTALAAKRPDRARDLQLELRALAEQAKRERDYGADRFLWDRGITVTKDVTAYQGDTALALLEFRASPHGTADVVVHREIIIINDE